jgi:predicted DNA-binding ribbon-helix-helix protein
VCVYLNYMGCNQEALGYTASMSSPLPRRQRRLLANGESSLVIRNVVVDGHRTSVRLEPMMWEALREIARRREVKLHELVTEIDRQRTASSLTAAIRVYIVAFYRSAASRAEWLDGPEARPRSPPLPM